MERAGKEAAVPDGWRMVRLGDVAALRNTQAVPSETDTRPYVALEHIQAGGALVGHAEASDAISNKTEFCSGDTLYGKLRPNLRKVVRVKFDGVCSTDILAIYGDGNADRRYLGHILGSDLLHGHAMRGIAGTKMPRTSWSHLRQYAFACPPLPEQRAIADVLDSIDASIERTEAIIAATETLRDSLLHELLTRGVPGWHTEWQDVPGIGTIPVDWEVVRLGEVLESTTYGTNEPLGDTGNIFVLRMNNIQQGEIDWSEVKRGELSESELNDLDLRFGDILFNRTNSLDLVGKIGMVRDMPDAASFASYLVRLRTETQRAKPTWLAALLGSSIYQARIRRFATPGVSQANINPTSLRSLTIPMPAIAEQQVTSAMLDSVDEQLRQIQAERDALHSLKESAGDALLTGRVRAMPPKGVHNDTADPVGAACKGKPGGGRRSANRLCPRSN